jgi:hypothetical protein
MIVKGFFFGGGGPIMDNPLPNGVSNAQAPLDLHSKNEETCYVLEDTESFR